VRYQDIDSYDTVGSVDAPDRPVPRPFEPQILLDRGIRAASIRMICTGSASQTGGFRSAPRPALRANEQSMPLARGSN